MKLYTLLLACLSVVATSSFSLDLPMTLRVGDKAYKRIKNTNKYSHIYSFMQSSPSASGQKLCEITIAEHPGDTNFRLIYIKTDKNNPYDYQWTAISTGRGLPHELVPGTFARVNKEQSFTPHFRMNENSMGVLRAFHTELPSLSRNSSPSDDDNTGIPQFI